MNTKTELSLSKTAPLGLFLIMSLLLLVAACSSSEGSTIGDSRATAEVLATEGAEEAEQLATDAFANVTAYCDDNPIRCIESGDPDSDIIVFEFSDYGCSGCKSFNDNITPGFKSQFVDTNQVRFLKVISAPLYPARWDSRPTAEAVMCANELGEGTAFHEAVFSVQVAGGNPSTRQMLDVGEDVGLDRDAFGDCIDSNKYAQAVNETTVLAQENGVTSTPTVLINGQRPANTSLSSIGQLISQLQQ